MTFVPNVLPTPPLIPGSKQLNTNQTIFMKINGTNSKLISQTITDSIMTINSGTISNVVTSSIPSSAVTKQYVDNLYASNPNGPFNSVQFRSGSSFNGDENLIYEEESNLGTLTVNGTIVSGTTQLSTDGKLTGLTDPTEDSQAAIKKYVDNFNKKNVVSITNSVGVQYTASQVVNSVILRNNLIIGTNINTGLTDISVKNIDLFPTATQILSQLETLNINPIIGTNFTFNLYNNSQAPLILQPFNNTVTFIPENVVINGNYQLTALGIVTGVIIPSVQIFIQYVGFINKQTVSSGVVNPNYSLIQRNNGGSITKTIRTDVRTFLPMNPTEYSSSSSKVYSYSDVMNKLIIRSGLINNTSDTFESTVNFFNQTFFENYTKDLGTEMSIMNVSNYSLTLVPGTGWTFNDSIVILPNHTAYLLITMNKETLSNTVNLVGLFNRN